MPLSVLFDHQIFTLQKYGGVSRYFVQLASGLLRSQSVIPKVVAAYHFNDYLRKAPSLLRTPSLALPYSAHRPINRCLSSFHRSYSSTVAHLLNPDIIHHTYYFHNNERSRRTPRVVTVYDMINEIYPESFPNNNVTVEAKKAAVRDADHVICISQNTLDDLLTFYPEVEKKATSIHLDVPNPALLHDIPTINRKRPYILYVGQRFGYKNFDLLLDVYLSTELLYKNFDLVAFGGPPFSANETAKIDESEANPHAIIHCNGPDDHLYAFLKSAQCLVYPSLYEGFGIPPLEAMHLGCPVVASHSSCLPEVLGEGVFYIDPFSAIDMRSALTNLLGSTHLQKELIRQGYMQSSKYASGKMINKTQSIYASLT